MNRTKRSRPLRTGKNHQILGWHTKGVQVLIFYLNPTAFID